MLTVMRTNKFTDVKHILNFNYPPPLLHLPSQQHAPTSQGSCFISTVQFYGG